MQIQKSWGVIILDDADYARLKAEGWGFTRHKSKVKFYVRIQKGSPRGPNRRECRLSRYLMGLKDEDGRSKVVDHINGDTFDNRRCNLRICTVAENNANKVREHGTLKKVRSGYAAQIYVGTFKTEQEARAACLEWHKKIYPDHHAGAVEVPPFSS